MSNFADSSQQNSVSIEKWLTPTLAPRPLWPLDHFGPTLRGGTTLCSQRAPANKRKLGQKDNYQACNNSYKLVTRMDTNLLLEKIMLLKIKSIFPS